MNIIEQMLLKYKIESEDELENYMHCCLGIGKQGLKEETGMSKEE